MGRALGKEVYMVNPKRCFCPWISTRPRSKCKERDSGTVELNRLNDLSNFISHLTSQHSDNEAAQVAAKRLKAADGSAKLDSTYLTTRHGAIDWEGTTAAGHEEIRSITDEGDAFEPDFELGTKEHDQWVQNAIAGFE